MKLKNIILASALMSAGLIAAPDASAQTSNLEAELRLSNNGMAQVTYESLIAQGIDWTGIDPSKLKLTQGTTVLPIFYQGPAAFGPGGIINFFGEEVSGSSYTKTSVYRLAVAASGSPSLGAPSYSRGNCRNNGGTRGVLILDPNRGYDIGSPHSSPWYAQRMVRNSTQTTGFVENFALNDKVAGAAGDRIEIGVWGGIDYAANPDHSLRVLLNGVEIATSQFDGLAYQVISANLAPDNLVNGNNVVRVELVGNTGATSDLVYLDSIRVDYSRNIKAEADRVAFNSASTIPAGTAIGSKCNGNAQCSKYLATGFTTNNLNVFRSRPGAPVERVNDVVVSAASGGYQACFTVADTAGDRYWIEPSTSSVNVAIAARAPVVNPIAGAPASYLIITHADFRDGLAPMVAAKLQEGYSVRVVDVAEIYNFYNRGVVDPDAIGTAIAEASRTLGTRYVLLVGGDTYDYFNYLNTGSKSFIPTYYLPNSTNVRFAPTDMPFSDVDADGFADVAVGRFPVRTPAELDRLIAKNIKYAQGVHAGKLLKVSDRNDGVPYEAILSGVDGVLGSATRATNISLNNYANSSSGMTLARNDIANAVNYGQSLLAYFGHIQVDAWTSTGLVNTSHVNAGLFANSDAPFVLWAMGCYGAYFTSPTGNSMTQALMNQANGGGAVAIIGSTSLSYADSDVLWMRVLAPYLQAQPLGDALVQAQRTMRAMGPQYADVATSGVLMGDPALQVR